MILKNQTKRGTGIRDQNATAFEFHKIVGLIRTANVWVRTLRKLLK